jgi:hypothetical protein
MQLKIWDNKLAMCGSALSNIDISPVATSNAVVSTGSGVVIGSDVLKGLNGEGLKNQINT